MMRAAEDAALAQVVEISRRQMIGWGRLCTSGRGRGEVAGAAKTGTPVTLVPLWD